MGNADGDTQMLETARFFVLLNHDDADREYSYSDGAKIVLPLIQKTRVASAKEIDVWTLQQRLGDEFRAHGAVLAHPTLFSACSTNDHNKRNGALAMNQEKSIAT